MINVRNSCIYCVLMRNEISTGCLPDYVNECIFDESDVFVCPASACQRDKMFFACSDGKYCIKKDLVCDGYAQCEDESGNYQPNITTG